MTKFTELTEKLREIFQIDRPELDFGVYRILNARAGEINEYLDKRLQEKVEEALASGNVANLSHVRQELAEAEKNARSLGANLDDLPKVKELRQRIAELEGGAAEHENAIFSHLLTFFSRYYDSGDFISQRRYKGDTYAIPYAGEEVVLHWANKDQYYTKSGESFSNYSFKLSDGRTVHCRLVAADTAKDNRKDTDKERRFALIEPTTVTHTDDDGGTWEEQLVSVEESSGELTLRFAYKPMPKGTKQNTLTEKAVKAILDDASVKARWPELAKREPTEKNPQRTLLEKHLTAYTQRNTADYFIHKNLGEFLRNELDFYIKNEVMNLDDVQNAETLGNIEKSLRMIQCFRAIALELIAFLAQLEDFQKKLWLKRKFVVSAHYCMTLDRVPEVLYPAIAANEKQWQRWHALGMRQSPANGGTSELRSSKYLTVDTSLFDPGFRAKLLASVEDIDRSLDGLLIHSDNFQAMRLADKLYRNGVDYIYIDPPFNTNSAPILYKNDYKHSSWASLLHDRLAMSMRLMRESGVMTVAIDDTEMANLSIIMEGVAPAHKLTRITVVHNPKGSITKDFNRVHEYALFLTPEGKSDCIARTLEANDTPRKMRRWGENSQRIDRRLSFYPIYVKSEKIVRVGTVPDDDFHPAGKNVPIGNGEIEVWPIDQNGVERRWNFGLDSINENLDRIVVLETDGLLDLFVTHEQSVPKTMWSGGEYDAGNFGNTLLIDILGSKKFDFPKSINLVKRCVYLATKIDTQQVVMDYFGGSGTTAHAVISQNRQDSGRRKYVVVEQGEYFDTVLKPRVQKIIYSADWSEGKPTNPASGSSHAFKVLRLESYEDTLNNLELRRSKPQTDLLDTIPDKAKEDYLLRYMLDVESRGSLLSVESFKKPFDFTLKVAVDSAGATEVHKVDFVETFNYLIGLTVKSIDADLERGFVTVEGRLPSGERTLVLWRDCERIDYNELAELCDKLAVNPSDSEYDVVYVNGDHNIASVLTTTEDEGGITRTLKLRQIEPEFLSAMFDVDDV